MPLKKMSPKKKGPVRKQKKTAKKKVNRPY
jgi:hypothetical protein